VTWQKIQWKVPIKDPSAVQAWDFFRAFSAWIPDSPEVFVDVADYRHVQDGVKVILVGHGLDVFLDDTGGVTGLACAWKRPMQGGDVEKLAATLNATFGYCRRLEADPIFSDKLKFKDDALFLTVNDRAAAPNTAATFEGSRGAIEKALAGVFPAGTVSLRHLDDAKTRFGVAVGISKSPEF
jgi:hypothetical protein